MRPSIDQFFTHPEFGRIKFLGDYAAFPPSYLFTSYQKPFEVWEEAGEVVLNKSIFDALLLRGEISPSVPPA